MENKKAKFIMIVAYTVLALGLLAGICIILFMKPAMTGLERDTNNYKTIGTYVMLSSVILFSILLGISEIVEKVSGIYDRIGIIKYHIEDMDDRDKERK